MDADRILFFESLGIFAIAEYVTFLGRSKRGVNDDVFIAVVIGQQLLSPRVNAGLHGHTNLPFLFDLIFGPSKLDVFDILFGDLSPDDTVCDAEDVVVFCVERRPALDLRPILEVNDGMAIFRRNVRKPAAVRADGRRVRRRSGRACCGERNPRWTGGDVLQYGQARH